MRLSRQQLADNEAKIRAAMTRLLDGGIPPGGKCDIKTLAREAGIDRTAFYGSRPYAHLREEFEQKLQDIQQAGEQPDPRDAQVERLKSEITQLRERLAQSADTVTELTSFRTQALARLAAQHDEITRLRHDLQRTATIRRLPAPAAAPVEEPVLPLPSPTWNASPGPSASAPMAYASSQQPASCSPAPDGCTEIPCPAGTEVAEIDWQAVITSRDAGQLSCSGGENRILRLAASIAAGIPVDLNHTLSGLDHAGIALVVRAVRHANGTRPDHYPGR